MAGVALSALLRYSKLASKTAISYFLKLIVAKLPRQIVLLVFVGLLCRLQPCTWRGREATFNMAVSPLKRGPIEACRQTVPGTGLPYVCPHYAFSNLVFGFSHSSNSPSASIPFIGLPGLMRRLSEVSCLLIRVSGMVNASFPERFVLTK